MLTFIETCFVGGQVEEAEGYLGGDGVRVHDWGLTHVQIEDEQGPLRFLYRLDEWVLLWGIANNSLFRRCLVRGVTCALL